jgi:uncharacterized membrane protein
LFFDSILPGSPKSEAFIQMPSPSPWRHVFAGTVFAITLMIGAFGGLWIDHRWSFSPWGTMSGAVIGFVVAFYNLVKEFKDDFN